MGWAPGGGREVPVPDLYEMLAAVGLDYGESFRRVRGVWRCGDELFVEAAPAVGAGGFGVHPVVLDAVFHGVLAGVAGARAPEPGTAVVLPYAFRGVRVLRRGASAVRVRIQTSESGLGRVVARDEFGRAVWSIEGVDVRRADAATLRSAGGGAGLYDLGWSPVAVVHRDTSVLWGIAPRNAVGDWGSGVVDRWFADVAGVLEALAAEPVVPAAVVVPCWGVPGAEGDVAEGARGSVLGVLGVLQEWFAAAGSSSVRLAVVTRGAVAVESAGDTGIDADGLKQSGVAGLVRSAQFEYPGRVVLVDAVGGLDSLAGALAGGVESELVVREAGVWAPRLGAVQAAGAPDSIPEQHDSPGGVERWGWDPAGLVLVAGGGELAGPVVRHLVTDRGVRDVVLASRSGGGAELAAELAEFGARVWCVACDLGDRAEVESLVRRAGAWGDLTAVVYTAGVLDDGVLAALSPERVVPVLRSKVDGAWFLHEATRELDLGGFVMFSSVAGTVGAPGQANYAAGNAFLDGLAVYRRGLGLAGCSIGWGLWDVSGGMSGGVGAVDRARLSRGGLVGISVPEGLTLWEAALSRKLPRVVAARFDRAGLSGAMAGLGGVVPSVVRDMVRGSRGGPIEGGVPAELMARLAGLPVSERRAVLVELVGSHVAVVLGHAAGHLVDAQESFLDLGFDSLAAVELRNRLAGATGVALPATAAFDHPTPEALAGYIDSCLPDGESGGTLDDALDRVAAELGSAACDTETRRRAARRLRHLLTTIEDAATPEGGADPDDDIRSAGAAELFELLDGELG
ncbi:type I polyketide synthase [Nocardia carnea]|uniref:type I polyketide synthase n=1 Tax=Nocardia carnea TaxID=37328 RepID=UPI0024573CE9|nr:type I polyketide synthase [Nocardia carnea]